MKLNYKKMLSEIDKLTNNDWCAEMEMRLLPRSGGYTQKEAKRMAKLLSRVYSISHCIRCEACQRKYLI